MNLSKYRKFSEKLYSDKFTINRYIDLEDDDGSTYEGLDPSPSLQDIPCRISVLREDEHKTNFSDSNNELVKLKIFCSPDVEVQKGDTIVAQRYVDNNLVDEFKGIASAPFKYNINQEFLLIQDSEA